MNASTAFKKYAAHFIVLPNVKTYEACYYLDQQSITHIFIEFLIAYLSEALIDSSDICRNIRQSLSSPDICPQYQAVIK